MAELVVTVVASIAISWLLSSLRPKPKNEVNYRLPSSSYGQPIPDIINYWRVTVNWIEPIKESDAFTIVSESSGGKGGGGNNNQQDVVLGTFLGLLSSGGEEGSELRRLYLNGDKKIDFDSVDQGTIDASNTFLTSIQFFPGFGNQLPFSPLETFYGIDKAIAYRNKVLIGFEDFDCTDFGNTFPSASAVLKSIKVYNLAQAVIYICQKAGIEPSLIDATELSNTEVRGLAINGGGEEYLKALETLMAAFFFFPVELNNGGIAFKFLKRPTITLDLTADALGAHELSETPPISFTVEYEDTTELPTQVIITYYNPHIDYEKDSIASDPLAGYANTNIEKIDLELVLLEAEAKTIANRYLFQIRNSYKKYKFTLNISYLSLSNTIDTTLSEGDLIKLPNGDVVQLAKLEIGSNYLLDCEANYYEGDSYEFTASIPETVTNRTEVNPIFSLISNPNNLTEYYVLDIPAIDGSETEKGIYFVSISPISLFYSLDDVNYEPLTNFTGRTIIGNCDTILNPIINVNLKSNDLPIIDLTSTLNVTLYNGELETITPSKIDLGFNLFFIGIQVNNQWEGEIVQARVCNLIGENQYTLSEFTRGLYGTTYYMDSHVAGEKIFLLRGTGSNYLRFNDDFLNFDTLIYYKGVLVNNQDLALIPAKQFQYKIKALYPYPVIDVELVSNQFNELILTWTKQNRFGFITGEQSENYLVELYSGTNLIAAYNTIEPRFVYSENDQIVDFGSVQSALTGKIYKISSEVGNGFVSEFDLTAIIDTTSIPVEITKVSNDVIMHPDILNVTGKGFSNVKYASVRVFLDGLGASEVEVFSDTFMTIKVSKTNCIGTGKIYLYTDTPSSNPPGSLYWSTPNYISDLTVTVLPRDRIMPGYIRRDSNFTPLTSDVGKYIAVDTTTDNRLITLDASILDILEADIVTDINTVLTDSSHLYNVNIQNIGTGIVTFIAGGSNNVLRSRSLTLNNQYDACTWYYVGKDENDNYLWYGVGALGY